MLYENNHPQNTHFMFHMPKVNYELCIAAMFSFVPWLQGISFSTKNQNCGQILLRTYTLF